MRLKLKGAIVLRETVDRPLQSALCSLKRDSPDSSPSCSTLLTGIPQTGGTCLVDFGGHKSSYWM